MKTVSVVMSDAEHERLRASAYELGVSKSARARALIVGGLAKKAPPAPRARVGRAAPKNSEKIEGESAEVERARLWLRGRADLGSRAERLAGLRVRYPGRTAGWYVGVLSED